MSKGPPYAFSVVSSVFSSFAVFSLVAVFSALAAFSVFPAFSVFSVFPVFSVLAELVAADMAAPRHTIVLITGASSSSGFSFS